MHQAQRPRTTNLEIMGLFRAQCGGVHFLILFPPNFPTPPLSRYNRPAATNAAAPSLPAAENAVVVASVGNAASTVVSSGAPAAAGHHDR